MNAKQRVGRGVYYQQHLVDGCEVLVAVKSNGDEVKPRIVLRPFVDRDEATEWLWQRLDQVDPVPQLAIVRDAPAERIAERPAPPPESSTAFLMRRARQYQAEGRVRRLS